MQLEGFDFKDINLIPRKCIVKSRNECMTDLKMGWRIFKMPVVPANMECIMNDEIAAKLASNGYFYIHHRFDVDAVAFCKKMMAVGLFTSISIGVNEDAYETINRLAAHNIILHYITIDIAHGHSIAMEKMLEYIRNKWGNEPFIIAGNVSTAEATRDLESW